MEEDIKILEEIVEIYYECAVVEEGFDMRVDMAFMKKEAQALKNLIKEYKELEEKNRIYALNGNNINLELHIKNKYIPKTLIKEKIEELNKEYGKLFLIGNTRSFDMCRAKIDILEELLKGKM